MVADAESGLPPRDDALALLTEFTSKPGLVKHALAVEAAMRAHARRLGAAEASFGLVGLLHDFDYERWPDAEGHPRKGSEILAERGYPEWFRRAILSHASYTGVTRETDLERCLFASDELCGFLTACALVMPDRSIHRVEVRSVLKRMKSKAFARSVSREDISRGAEEIDMTLEAHVEFVLEALRGIAPELELDGGAS